MDAVFIVGCMRTGSKIYVSALKHTPINMTPELHFMSPSWLHKDFIRITKDKIGNLQRDENIIKLVDLMYSGGYYGTFWKTLIIEPNQLTQKILQSDRTFKSVFGIILQEHANYRQKKICGAKFPVHVSFVPTLLEWYPNCKIIHLFRDPRAIFASQLAKITKRRQNKRAQMYLPILFHTLVQTIWSFRVYHAHRSLENYYVSLYEDMVTRPEESLKNICNFLGIHYSANMLNMRVKDSSFVSNKWGISEQNKDRWKKVISPATSNLIRILAIKQMKRFGYR